MEVTYECKEPRLQKNFRHTVIAMDERGNIVGTYHGYWTPGQRIMTLYPNHKHAAYKPWWRLNVKKVYDGNIRCKMQNAGCKTSTIAEDSSKGDTRRDRKSPLPGQESIKFWR